MAALLSLAESVLLLTGSTSHPETLSSSPNQHQASSLVPGATTAAAESSQRWTALALVGSTDSTTRAIAPPTQSVLTRIRLYFFAKEIRIKFFSVILKPCNGRE